MACMKSGVAGLKPVHIYIPQNLDPQRVMSQTSVKIPADYLAFFVHIVIVAKWHQSNKKREWKGKGRPIREMSINEFVGIHSNTLKRLIPGYKKVIEAARELGVVDYNEHYQGGGFSKSFRLNKIYQGWNLRRYSITNTYILKRFNDQHRQGKLREEPDFLIRWLEGIDLDSNKVRHLLGSCRLSKNGKCFDQLKKRNQLLCAMMIEDKRMWWYGRDNTSNRFHSPITNLKGKFRKFLRYKGERIIGFDITNSQPLFSLLLIKEVFPEIDFSRINTGPEHLDQKIMVKATTGTLITENGDHRLARNISSLPLTNIKQPSFSIAKPIYPPPLTNVNIDYTALVKSTSLNIPTHNTIPPSIHTTLPTLMLQDLYLYIELVIEGRLYEYLHTLLKRELRLGDRYTKKKCKKEFFALLFDDTRKYDKNKELKKGERRFKKRVDVFRNHFPLVYDLFDRVKYGELNISRKVKTKKSYARLAVLLQSIESELIIEVVCKRISRERSELPLFTIHDHVATVEGNEKYVKRILEEELKKMFGFIPRLKMEKWFNDD